MLASRQTNSDTLTVCLCSEIDEVAGELARMSNQSNGRIQAPSALQMSMQLGDMLEQKANQVAVDAEALRHDRTKLALQEERQKVRALEAEVKLLMLLHANYVGTRLHMYARAAC